MKKNLKQPLAVLLAANMALSAAAPTMSAYAEEGKTENEVENVSTVSDGKNTNEETTDGESDPKNENDSTGNTDDSDGEEKRVTDVNPVDSDNNKNESATKDVDGDTGTSELLNSGDSVTTDTDVAGNNMVSDDTEDDTEIELATTDGGVDNNVTTSDNNTLNSNDIQTLNGDSENAVNDGINTASSDDTVTIEAYIGDSQYNTKEYDGTNKAYCAIGLRGLDAGDSGKVKIASYDATYDTSAVGDDIEITVTNIQLSGEAASKYQAALDGVTLTATGSITQRTIDVYVAAQSKKYDGTNTANLYACGHTSFVSHDIADISVTGTFEDANAGTGKKISIGNVEITGTDANNYVIGTVKPATISGTAGNYTVTEVDTLTADITKGFIAAPSVDLFSVENGNVVGFTDKMEYSTDGTTWTDCNGLAGIPAVSDTTYQFRYKGDTANYDLGVTRYTYQGVKASVKLTYSLNGEKVSGNYPASCTFSVGTVYTANMLPTLTSADTDRVFTGWYTEAVGGTKITAGMTCNNTSDFTLYAHFEEDTNKQAGDIEVSAKNVMYGNYPDVTVANAGKSDYTRFVKYYKVRDAKDDTYTTTQPTDPGNYTVKVVASGSPTYKSVEKTADFSITKMQIVYTLTPKDKVYDASTSVSYDKNNFTCTSGGILSWNGKKDDADVDFTGFKVSFEDKNAGDNKKVIASGLNMTGADADKYEVTCVVNGTANITKASIAYTENAELSDNVLQYNLKAKSKTYDGETTAEVVGSVAKYSGDDIKVVAAGAFSDANAGENKTVNIANDSVTLTGTDAKNYQLEIPSAFSVTGTIWKAQNNNSVNGIVKFHNPTNGLNNGSITGLTTDMEYSSDGKNTWTAATGDSVTGLAAGTYYVRYKETTNYYASGATYATLTNSGSSTTTKITVQFDVNGESVSESSVASVSATVGKTYGTLPTVTPTDANREFVGWFTDRTGGTEVTKDTVCAATDVTTLYAHYRDKSVVKNDGKITVSAADITYGDAVSASYAVVDGDYKDANVTYYYKVSGADDKTYSTTEPTVPGTYTVKAVASATANFAETSATADFKIAQKRVTVTVTANTKTYDGTTSVTGYKCTTDKSILADDDVEIDTSKAVIKFKDASVGTDKELIISGITLTGAQSDRYELVVTGTGTIEERQKADGKITVSVNDFTYGETASEVKVENVTGDYTVYETFYRKSGATNWGTTMPVNPGTYEVLVVAAATDAYNETEEATTFTIKKALQSAPTIKAESGQNLECITGTTADMEYSTNKATWHSCSDGATSVPSSGTYYVRYKETATKAASDAVVYEVVKNEVTVNFVSDGTVVKTITVKNGQTIDASQVPQLTKKGKKISCWYGFMTGRDEAGSAQMFFSFNFGKDIITNEGNQVIITSDEHKEGFVADHNQTCHLHAMWVADESSKDAGQIAVEMSDFTYGYTAPSPIKNVITGDYQTVTFQYKPADAADTAYTSIVPTLPGNYIVKATASATDIYKEAVAYDTFTINKRQLNLSVTVDAKDYDGTTDVTGYHIEVADNNIARGDDVSLDVTNASVQFASSDAGTHALSVSGVGFTGAQKDCYEVGTISGSGTIRRKSISNITVNAEDRDYDATNNVNVTLTSSDVLLNDAVVLTGTATLDSSEPGTRTVTVTDISMSGADIGNYDLSKTAATGTMTVRDTTKNVTFDTTGVTVKGSFDGIMSLRPYDKYPALPDAESTDPEYKFVGWAKEDGTRVYEGTEYLGETSLKPVLEKITDFSYSIQYVTEAGEVLETVTGTAHNNESVTAEAKTLKYYEYTGNEAFIVNAGNTNVFKAVCKERVFNIELVMVNETTGKIFAREKGTYSINHPYEKMSGAVPAHMHFTGFSGHSVNHGTWSFAGYESDTTWSFDLSGYVEDCWIYLGFTADPSDVTFNANGGEGSMSDVYASDVTNLPANTFTKKNYTFKGWSTTADGDVEYADGALVSNIPSGTTLYAVWEKTTVNVKFDLGGVDTTADIPSIVVALGDKYPALPVPVAKDSKISFIGWFTKDGVEVHTGDDFDGENTLYARFKSRKEGMIKLNAKDYAYGDTSDISANIVSGDYSESDISYCHRDKSSTEWTDGLPTLPGEYVVRATAAENDEMLSATAEADVTVSQRTLNFHLDNTGKTYNGDAVAAPTYVLDNKVENDDVTVSGTAAYDSALPGDRVLKVTGITLSGADAAKYKLESDTVEAKAHIDKMTAEAVCVTSRNESIWGKNDGALFSTTTAMEYRVNGEKWIDASATVTDNLESGMYEVRMKETDVSYAGPAQTVPIYADRTLKENLTDVTGYVTTYGVRYGTKIDKPADLYKSGYTFVGWYADAAFTTKYDFNSVVTDDVYLYPKFTRNSSSSGGSSSGGSGVTDIKAHSSASTDTAITAVNGTWTMDSDRHWRLTNGEKSYRSEWVYAVNPYANVANGQPGSSWFHFDADGIMETGWFTDTDGRMYYLNPTSDGTLGAMFTGWHWIKQESGVKYCYYFQEISDGHRGMLYKGTTTPDGYTVDETGAWTVSNIVVEK